MADEGRRERAIKLLNRLTQAHGAPGSEGPVRRIFRDELGSDLYTDNFGNIVYRKRGTENSPKVMISGHMDEVGMMVQALTRDGLIKFVPLGGWWSHTLLAQRIRILTQAGTEVIGVIGAKPPHLMVEGERDKLMKLEAMFIDVGATSAEDLRVRFGIGLGDTIVPESSFTPMGNPDYLLSKAFDNRVGMALTIQAAELLGSVAHPNTVYAVGTVQEEVGTRGARTAVYGISPDVAIVLEGTPADDLPGMPEDERQGVLGMGPQLRLMDPSAIMNRKLANHVLRVAEQHGLPCQVAVRRGGGTDAHEVQLHGPGVPTVVIGVPARYIHSHNGILYIGDYLVALELVLKLTESLDEETVVSFTAFED